MDEKAKKTALRMIPYGLYVLTARSSEGMAAATVNWVTQASFEPPLVVVAVKRESRIYGVIRSSGAFALNFLGKDQGAVAYAFFKPVESDERQIGGYKYEAGVTGSPLLRVAPAFAECRVAEVVERGDHAVVIGEVVEAGVRREPEGRPDEAILWLKDLGPNIFYGG
ncbi:MAG: flavin reductase family protein [Blastocatellia bacterium]|nr:flavin reductase family protein [Blastocatellia bacterium]MCS7157984.1 flavin reductase family protein [Blastocatellia bacterium]MCX7752491.1 flavin reductase family protein [Blastocatellia bacterium]MDW8167394.1 flavin reductase family protein [Acidobacteriota bacterium]MDW8257428.1 flavin reductase family protein [Acidobacteriota bacterium]